MTPPLWNARSTRATGSRGSCLIDWKRRYARCCSWIPAGVGGVDNAASPGQAAVTINALASLPGSEERACSQQRGGLKPKPPTTSSCLPLWPNLRRLPAPLFTAPSPRMRSRAPLEPCDRNWCARATLSTADAAITVPLRDRGARPRSLRPMTPIVAEQSFAAATGQRMLGRPCTRPSWPPAGDCLRRVGPAPCGAGPPSEPDVPVSEHPAQASPDGWRWWLQLRWTRRGAAVSVVPGVPDDVDRLAGGGQPVSQSRGVCGRSEAARSVALQIAQRPCWCSVEPQGGAVDRQGRFVPSPGPVVGKLRVIE